MKEELIRIEDGIIKQGKSLRGPFFFHLYKGEISGIVTDNFEDRKLIENFFAKQNGLMSGTFFYKGEKYNSQFYNSEVRKKLCQNVTVISDATKLTNYLSITDNIFIYGEHFSYKKRKQMVLQLMEFFDLNIPVNKKIRELSFLEQVEIQLLHAVGRHNKIIIVCGVNGKLNLEELEELERFYTLLVGLNYSICQIETYNTISLERMDRIHILKKGKTIAEFNRTEISKKEVYKILDNSRDFKNVNDRKSMSSSNDRKVKMNWISHTGETIWIRSGEITNLVCGTSELFITLKNYFCGEKVELNGSFYWENKRVTPKLAKNLKRKRLLGMIDYTDIEHILFDNLSILENLCYPLCQKKRGFFLKKKYGELVKEYVNTISPDITLDKKTKELSLEQIMYLAVCRWMICKPQVLIIFIPVFLIKPQTDYVMERILIELKKYGHALGMAFQITDDIMDYRETTETTGKPVGNDLREGLLTYPLLSIVNDGNKDKLLEDIKGLNNGGNEQDIIDYVIAQGGIDNTLAVADKYCKDALAALAAVRDFPGKEFLVMAVENLADRKV